MLHMVLIVRFDVKEDPLFEVVRTMEIMELYKDIYFKNDYVGFELKRSNEEEDRIHENQPKKSKTETHPPSSNSSSTFKKKFNPPKIIPKNNAELQSNLPPPSSTLNTTQIREDIIKAITASAGIKEDQIINRLILHDSKAVKQVIQEVISHSLFSNIYLAC